MILDISSTINNMNFLLKIMKSSEIPNVLKFINSKEPQSIEIFKLTKSPNFWGKEPQSIEIFKLTKSPNFWGKEPHGAREPRVGQP